MAEKRSQKMWIAENLDQFAAFLLKKFPEGHFTWDAVRKGMGLFIVVVYEVWLEMMILAPLFIITRSKWIGELLDNLSVVVLGITKVEFGNAATMVSFLEDGLAPSNREKHPWRYGLTQILPLPAVVYLINLIGWVFKRLIWEGITKKKTP